MIRAFIIGSLVAITIVATIARGEPPPTFPKPPPMPPVRSEQPRTDARPRFEWTREVKGQLTLRDETGKQVGAWRIADGVYMKLAADGTWEYGSMPAELPKDVKAWLSKPVNVGACPCRAVHGGCHCSPHSECAKNGCWNLNPLLECWQ